MVYIRRNAKADGRRRTVGYRANGIQLEGETQWQLYRDPLLLNKEGAHTVSFRSIDKAGNMERPWSVVVSSTKRRRLYSGSVLAVIRSINGYWSFVRPRIRVPAISRDISFRLEQAP
ncbi:OmpL47-type beta-barrel domain-containing protein [Paenibacillus elgii]